MLVLLWLCRGRDSKRAKATEKEGAKREGGSETARERQRDWNRYSKDIIHSRHCANLTDGKPGGHLHVLSLQTQNLTTQTLFSYSFTCLGTRNRLTAESGEEVPYTDPTLGRTTPVRLPRIRLGRRGWRPARRVRSSVWERRVAGRVIRCCWSSSPRCCYYCCCYYHHGSERWSGKIILITKVILCRRGFTSWTHI